jgi:hypothetical protein
MRGVIHRFVVSEDGDGLVDVEDAMDGPESVAADGNLYGRGGL